LTVSSAAAEIYADAIRRVSGVVAIDGRFVKEVAALAREAHRR
jgi:hypothetical protein